MSGHTFVCYAREDEDFVLKLASKLKSRGARVWVDKQDIPAAADWDRSIDQAIKDSGHFLIVLSPHAESSQEVRGELRMALDNEKPVVPILYKNCEIPRQLRTDPGTSTVSRCRPTMRGCWGRSCKRLGALSQ